MNKEEYIAIRELSGYYQVEESFFSRLDELGLIRIHTVEKVHCVHHDEIRDLERMLRLHEDLEINPEGIDTIFNLLQRIEDLQLELREVRSRLRFYEKD